LLCRRPHVSGLTWRNALRRVRVLQRKFGHDEAWPSTGWWCFLQSKVRFEKERPMATLATTRMSSKGQVVIPEAVRKRLGLEPGTRFVVVGKDDVVILKSVRPPSMCDFDALIAEARRQARAAGMKRSSVIRAVASVRGQK
jgi:AbrB family looped-hinge helix DNA binding protein